MKAVIWTKENCTYCIQAKTLLNQKNIPYEENKIGSNYTVQDLLDVVPTAKTVPQVFLDGNLIGGFDQLKKHFEGQS